MDYGLALPDDEIAMLKWLFPDGFEYARRTGDSLRNIQAMQALEPRIASMIAGVPAHTVTMKFAISPMVSILGDREITTRSTAAGWRPSAPL